MRTVANVSVLSCVLVCASSVALAAEGRTPIYAPGTVITSSGKYILTRSLSGPGIQINASVVDLDLNGFEVEANGGVAIQVAANEVRIHNGTLTNASVAIDGGVTRAVIEDLRITTATIAGIRLNSVNNFMIRRVLITSTGDGIRIINGSPSHGRIESCQLAGGSGRGISIDGASSSSIVDNNVTYFTDEGIYVGSCDACLVSRNTVTQSGGLGAIYLSGVGRGVALTGNTATANRSHGMHIATGARSTVVENNVLTENGSGPGGGDGLRFEGSTGKVVGNTMDANNGVGLNFTSTSYWVAYGRNSARNNSGTGTTPPCTGTPTLVYPESCNNGSSNTTFGDNLIPGPPLF